MIVASFASIVGSIGSVVVLCGVGYICINVFRAGMWVQRHIDEILEEDEDEAEKDGDNHE